MIAAAAVIGGIGGIIACREKIWGFFCIPSFLAEGG